MQGKFLNCSEVGVDILDKVIVSVHGVLLLVVEEDQVLNIVLQGGVLETFW